VLGFSNLKGEAQTSEINLNRILERVQDNLNTLIVERNAQVEFFDLPVVFGDVVYLTQLFQNLISNAIKYNTSEIPKVCITCERKGTKDVVLIADNGIGIPERYHKKVFELFQRLHSKDKYSGSGIGLAVCKKIMQQMDGDIYVSDNPSGGSVFHLEFPVQKSLL
jgi:light-regulated signal transduction histidine kinase (bacteriophytochrome)